MKEGILVVDVGTSKVHVNLVDIASGELIEASTSPYQWIHPQEGWSEINPSEIWNAIETSMGYVVQETKGKCAICALAFSYVGDSLIPVDKNHKPLGNMILAFDARAKCEADEFVEKFGANRLAEITGSGIMPELVPFKIMWLKKHKPEIFGATHRFWTIQQYINHQLGLGDVTDYTLACRKILMDVREKKWSQPLCDFLQISPDMLGDDVETADSIIGSVRRFGSVSFEHELPVILGAHDSESGMVGLGCITGSDSVIGNITGTYDHVGYLVDRYVENLEKYNGFITSYCGPLKGSYVFMGATIAGPNLDWFVNTFFPNEGSVAITRLFDATCFDGTNNLYLTNGVQTGEGCISGINFDTTLENIFIAIIEGVTYPLKDTMNQMLKFNGRKFGSMRVGGGGAKSDHWLQLKANMFDICVERVSNIEISSVGAAIMAAVSLGYYASLDQAMQSMISVSSTFYPSAEIVQRYNERHVDYQSR